MIVGRNLIQNLYANVLAIVLPLALHQHSDLKSIYTGVTKGLIPIWQVGFYFIAVVYILDFYLVREKMDGLMGDIEYQGHGPTLRYWFDLVTLAFWLILLFAVQYESTLLYCFSVVMVLKVCTLWLLKGDLTIFNKKAVACQYVSGLYQIAFYTAFYLVIFLFAQLLYFIGMSQAGDFIVFCKEFLKNGVPSSAFVGFVAVSLLLSWLLRAVSAWDIFDGDFVRVRSWALKNLKVLRLIDWLQKKKYVLVLALVVFGSLMPPISRAVFLLILFFMTFLSQLFLGKGLFYRFCLLRQARRASKQGIDLDLIWGVL